MACLSLFLFALTSPAMSLSPSTTAACLCRSTNSSKLSCIKSLSRTITYNIHILISPSPLCPCWQPLQLPGQPSDSGHAGTHGPCAAVASSCLTANMSHVTSLHGTHMELHKMLACNYNTFTNNLLMKVLPPPLAWQ